jgi:Uma2 family endonuclease
MASEERNGKRRSAVLADLIDGEILVHAPVSLLHANLTNSLDRLLAAFIGHGGLGGVHHEVIAVRMSQRSVIMPDIAFYERTRIVVSGDAYPCGAHLVSLIWYSQSNRTACRRSRSLRNWTVSRLAMSS